MVPVEIWEMKFTARSAMAQYRAIIRRLLVVSVLAGMSALAGCSAVRLAYHQAPELAYWVLDDYADFNGAQSL